MLYQLSYASSLRGNSSSLEHSLLPRNPFLMSGTILKVTITALYVQPKGGARVGTAALGCPVERSSTVSAVGRKALLAG
jgi:hypothetical protein